MTLHSSILFLLSLVMSSLLVASVLVSATSSSSSFSSSSSSPSSSSSSSSRYTGHVAAPTHPEDVQHRIPNEYNFCTSQQCTPTWNQYSPQYCGSCFIHAALSSISDRMIAVTDGKINVMLARQDVLNCGAPHDLGAGCKGGEADDVFEYVYRYGIPDETCNTYRAEPSQQCDAKARCMTCTPPQSKHADPTSTCEAVKEYTTYHITSYGTLQGEAAMRAEIYARGPIVCGMALSDAFASWNGDGIYRENQTTWSEDDINHDIEVVGWGEENGQAYWVVKNSFGSFWGDEGYARLARGVNESLVISTCDFPLLDRTTYRKQIQHGVDMFALAPVSFAAAAAVSSEGQPSHHQPTQHSHNPEATDPKRPTRGPTEEDEKPPANHPSADIAYDDSHNPASTVSLSSLDDTSSTLSTSSILVLILSCLICISIFTILYCALHLRSFDLQTAWKRSIKQLTPTSATSEERIPILSGEFPPAQQMIIIPHKFPTITIPADSGTPIHVLPAHTAASIATTVTNTPSSPSPPSACSSTKSTPRTTPLKSCRRLSQTPSDKPTLPKRVSWANFHKIGSHENLSQSAAIQAEMHRASCEDGKISPPLVNTRPSYLTINVE